MSRRTLQGEERRPADAAGWRRALDEVVDYRGDVTLELQDGSCLVGFVFNAEAGPDPSWLELFPTGEDTPKRRVAIADLRAVRFSGRDTADGRSWEAWAAKNPKKSAPGA